MAVMDLSPEQRQAVARAGQDACCVAGPGSGKTTVLVERFAWLVEQGLDPASSLAITFTEKAATQIKAKLVKRFRDDAPRRRAMERAPVSTVHAFCLGLLREHALAAELDPAFTVMDERESEAEQSAAMETVLDRLAAQRQPEFAAWADAWPASDMAKALRSVYESLRMGGGAVQALSRLAQFDPRIDLDAVELDLREMLDASPAPTTDAQRRRFDTGRAWLAARAATDPLEWLAAFTMDKRGLKTGHPLYDGLARLRLRIAAAQRACVGALHTAQRATARDALIAFEQEYLSRKRARAVLDFTDLEERALALLEGSPELRRLTQERYDAVLMDELQDTNPVQWRILDCVRRAGRFFAVGDINQSIYGFRHAVPQQFSAFEQAVSEQGGIIDRLERNYRSREEILAAVTAITVTQPCAGVSTHRLLTGRAYPAAAGPFVEVQRAESSEGNEEALWLARRLRELHGTPVGDPPRPARFSDMAILARSNQPFDALEAALERFSIPCVVARGRNFFEAPEILDLTNWLRVLDNPLNEIPLYALLRSPFFGISDQELMRLRLNGRQAPEEALARIGAARALRDEIPVDRTLARLLDDSGYLYLLAPRARSNVDKFLGLMRELDAAAPGDLAGHLDHIAELRATGKEPHAPEVEAADAVQILSVHSAKGLEFPIVALAFMQRGAGGFDQPVCWSPRLGLGLRWRVPGSTESLPDPVFDAFHSELSEREKAEEDRLLYVAMTRAEERLVLSWTEKKGPGSRWPAQVEAGLRIAWPAGLDEVAESEHCRVVRRAGEPELLDPPHTLAATEPVVVSPRPATPQAPAGVAVTSLSVFDACPRRYFLQSVLGWPRPQSGEATGATGAMALGTEVHEYLGGLRAEASPEARELSSVFEQSELAARAGRAARVERELDFLADIGGTLLRGQIDLYFEQDGLGVLVDYKTDRHMNDARLRAYTLQLRLYALALERTTGRAPREAWLFSLRDGTAHAVDVSPAALTEARQAIERWSDAETRGDFPLRETAECRWCPFVAGACPSEASN
jgi:ATP-dependent exoDNAse (exonuclease V) beta subunit